MENIPQEPNINESTEEVRHIIGRMPTRFGNVITGMLSIVIVSMCALGWFIKYPDIVVGQIVVNGVVGPVKLISNSNGKLKIRNTKSLQPVKEGQIIAYIENPAVLDNVLVVDSVLANYSPSQVTILDVVSKIPKNLALGELNVKYYAFVNALQQLSNYKNDKLFEKKITGFSSIIIEQKKAVTSSSNRIEMAKKSLEYVQKFYKRDSVLHSKKVISDSELDKTEMSYIASKDALQSSINNLTQAKQQIQRTEAEMQEIQVTKPEKERDLWISVISSYNDLVDNIKNWETKYVFRAPFDGQLQFLKFYAENQYVQNGEQVFSIVPLRGNVIGQLMLPSLGSGKIRTGQEVIVKLDNFPYMEYGSIKGNVSSISLTTAITKTEKADVDTYLVIVDFPNQLKTSYGTKLSFKADAKGSAEIITHQRRLFQRLFDRLKYVVNE